jgi:hypothetical protein
MTRWGEPAPPPPDPSASPSPPSFGSQLGPPGRGRRRLVLVLVAVVALLAASGGGVLLAKSTGSHRRHSGAPAASATATTSPATASTRAPATTAAPSASGALAAQVHQVEAAVERLRQLRFLRSVPVTVESPQKMAAQLLKELNAETNDTRLNDLDRALEVLGELPPHTDLAKLLRAVQTESVLGFYVPGKPPAKGRLYVRSNNGLDPYARFVLSHELTHAVTDQHYDLTRGDRLNAPGKDDQSTAYTALLEGDATVMMGIYHGQVLTPAEQADADRVGVQQATPQLDAAPAALRESLLFPYQAGVAFVRALLQRGGWAAVDRAYLDPPASSEQILHPEKYFGPRDQPKPVAVPDLSGSLGRGWRSATVAGWGEFDVRLMLEGTLGVAPAERAAAGWGGGELRSFQDGGETAVVLRTVWDSTAEASEYCGLLATWATSRFGAPTAEAASGRHWAGSGQQTALVCRGTAATWLSAPDGATLNRLTAGTGTP